MNPTESPVLQAPWVVSLARLVRERLGYDIPSHRMIREVAPFTVAEAEARGLVDGIHSGFPLQEELLCSEFFIAQLRSRNRELGCVLELPFSLCRNLLSFCSVVAVIPHGQRR